MSQVEKLSGRYFCQSLCDSLFVSLSTEMKKVTKNAIYRNLNIFGSYICLSMCVSPLVSLFTEMQKKKITKMAFYQNFISLVVIFVIFVRVCVLVYQFFVY